MLLILKLRSSFVFCKRWKIIPKDFPNASSMYVIVTTFIIIFLSFASESRVVRNTILLQRDVLWTGKI